MTGAERSDPTKSALDEKRTSGSHTSQLKALCIEEHDQQPVRFGHRPRLLYPFPPAVEGAQSPVAVWHEKGPLVVQSASIRGHWERALIAVDGVGVPIHSGVHRGLHHLEPVGAEQALNTHSTGSDVGRHQVDVRSHAPGVVLGPPDVW
jgi:hypothetical protein